MIKRILFLLLLTAAAPARSPVEFKKRLVDFGGKKLSVEMAETETQVERGLMFRTVPLKDDQGMLFVFKKEKPLTFWMKNTFIPLSIGFFDKDKKLVYVTEMQPVRSEMETPKTYPCPKPAMYALELAAGWFDRNNVPLGTAFKYR